MSTCSAQAVLLILIHLRVILITAAVSEVPHVLQLLIKSPIALTRYWKAKVSWIKLISSVCPFAFSSITVLKTSLLVL